MRKALVFKNFEAFEEWILQFENCYEWEQIPTAIDDGFKVSMDLFTECKNWKTVLRRFEKAFSHINSEVHTWVEGMQESCESGYFRDTTGCYPAWTNDPEEIKEFLKGGAYSWALEEVREGYWYVYLNISGIYAGR